MSSMHDEPVDEVAAAEAELKAAQEKLAAAKARQAAAREADGAASASAAAQEAATYEAAGGMGGASGQKQAGGARDDGAAKATSQEARGAQGANGSSSQNAAQVPPYGNQAPYGAPGTVPPQQPHYGYQRQTYGQQAYNQQSVTTKDHVAAGLLAIFLGALGVHKFYLGYNTSGFIMLAVTILGGIFTFSIATWVVWIIAIIEGIIYLTKTQSEFEQIYVFNKREWF